MTPTIGTGPPRFCPYCGRKLVDPDEAPETVPHSEDDDVRRAVVWRNHRRVHLPYFAVPEEEEGKWLEDEGDGGGRGPEEDIETQTFEVTFHDEHVEHVTVEAATTHQAKDRAAEVRTYDGEFTHTVHTETDALDDRSQASDDYLAWCGISTDGDGE